MVGIPKSYYFTIEGFEATEPGQPFWMVLLGFGGFG